MIYERTVKAALAETRSKFALAEALAEEIPPRRSGPSEDAKISEYLADARQEIINAGGEVRDVGTLREYRYTALWVRGVNATNYRWISGASFTAHNEARKTGITYDDFAANPRTARELRVERGRPTAEREIVQSWSPEQKVEAARALLAEPEVTEQVIEDDAARSSVRSALDERYQQAPKPYPLSPNAPGSEPFELLSEFRKLHTAMDHIVQLVTGGRAVVNDAERDALIKEVEWLRAALDHTESGLQAGSLDAALRAFQEEWL